MIAFLERRADGRTVGTTFLALIALLGAMNAATTAFHDATGAGILNLLGARSFLEPAPGGYSAEIAHSWLTAYGPDGRLNHLLILLLDVPLVLAMTAFTTLSLTYGIARPLRLRALAATVPLAGAALNYLEDIGVAVLLISHPVRLDGLAVLLGGVNAIKSTAYTIALVTALVALTAGLARRRRRHGAAPD
ncbi:hypothetical protein [Rhizohabitans arisaemae]|uniref:hypothetical protein n=1 Tax=Rhizohabitans arisaemae TaxID=2720610 RepID=UPI0024B1E957|nr:hypothetical protein [Rhizohabitans arisaemae]